MTDPIMQKLDEMQARCDAATEGPWEEEWRAIPGHDGYEVSDFGNVRSYYLKGNHIKKRSAYPRLLKTVAGRKGGGYQTVSLKGADGKYRHKPVHRLVMLAFAGPCPDGKEVAHLNGDPTDARLSNLAYVTHAENESHKRAHGTRGVGERNSIAKLQNWQVEEIKYLAERSIPQAKIAALFDISHKTVNDILRGASWSETPARTDMPLLIAAIKAVAEEHYPVGEESDCRCCPQECACGVWEYPCVTVKVLTKAMEVES